MQEKILLPNMPQKSITGDGPKFKDEIFKKINKAKSNGWGQDLKKLLIGNKQIPFVILILSILIVSTLIFTNQKTSLNTAATITPQKIALENLALDTATQPIILDVNSESTTIAAVSGSGITHLARTAINQYLAVNNLTLGAEQMIYAEDYLQNLTGTYNLEIGQEINFSTADIQTAINEATTLQDWQIQNLSQYVN